MRNLYKINILVNLKYRLLRHPKQMDYNLKPKLYCVTLKIT